MENKKNKQPKLKVRTGDLVKVIAGDSKGSQGKITAVNRATSRVTVEGVNMVSKHTKPNAANPNGGIVKQEAAMHVSNVALIDAKTGATTRVGRKADKDGKLVRFSKKSGEEIK